MITHTAVNSYRERHPWGTFPTFFFVPCSSWGNNDKVMKQSRRLFGVYVQINKSSGALWFEAERARTQQRRDTKEGERKRKGKNDSSNIYHNYDYSSFMSSSSRAARILTRMRLMCFGGNLFHFTRLVCGSELLHFICSCLIFLPNWFGLAACAGRTHIHWLAVCALAPINSICQFAFCNHTVWLCPSFHRLDN